MQRAMTEEQRERFEERAAICEYHGGLDRAEAERVAREEIEQDGGDK